MIFTKIILAILLFRALFHQTPVTIITNAFRVGFGVSRLQPNANDCIGHRQSLLHVPQNISGFNDDFSCPVYDGPSQANPMILWSPPRPIDHIFGLTALGLQNKLSTQAEAPMYNALFFLFVTYKTTLKTFKNSRPISIGHRGTLASTGALHSFSHINNFRPIPAIYPTPTDTFFSPALPSVKINVPTPTPIVEINFTTAPPTPPPSMEPSIEINVTPAPSSVEILLSQADCNVSNFLCMVHVLFLLAGLTVWIVVFKILNNRAQRGNESSPRQFSSMEINHPDWLKQIQGEGMNEDKSSDCEIKTKTFDKV